MALTAHLYAGDSDKLWKTYVGSGTHTGTPVDGELVAVWQDEATPGTRDVAPMDDPSGKPTWRSPGVMLLPSLDFDGTDDFFGFWNNVGNTRINIGSLVSASAGSVIFAFRLQGDASNNANIWTNTALLCDSSGYMGIHFKTITGTTYVYGYNYDGSEDVTTGIAVSPNTDYVVYLRHAGGTLYLYLYSSRTSSSSESVASGNQSGGASATLGKGAGAATYFNGCVGEAYIDNADLDVSPAILTTILERWFPGGGVRVLSTESMRLLLAA